MPETGVPTCYRHPGREAHIRCQRCNRVICPECMRPASVGFQCPECVAEGAKQTRQARTAYGGLRPTDASRTSIVLIALNVAVWIAVMVTGGSSSRLVDWLALRPNGLCISGRYGADVTQAVCDQAGGTFLPGVVDGAYWQLVTSMFMHVQPLHIGFNMLALWVLGPQLELAIGRARFLALYFISGLAGSALVYWAASEYGATLGASGAIFGLMGALAVIAFKVGGDVRGILTWIGINFVITFVVARISWQGHLGGFLGGLAVAAILVYAPRGPRRTAFQTAGLCFVLAVVLFAIAARSVVLG
ncbi:rhomboid family intramembrane serine protease [Nocardioides flavescens]|uniref:rhomboid family intramembrane serine protease n=1 Tax=Nocardioides flavescens TaxID=2691959 RepID=UPI00301D2A47